METKTNQSYRRLCHFNYKLQMSEANTDIEDEQRQNAMETFNQKRFCHPV